MADKTTRVLLRAVPTGRKNKMDEVRSKAKIGGVNVTVIENDSWEGSVPDEGIRQQYHRCTWIEYPSVRWNHD